MPRAIGPRVPPSRPPRASRGRGAPPPCAGGACALKVYSGEGWGRGAVWAPLPSQLGPEQNKPDWNDRAKFGRFQGFEPLAGAAVAALVATHVPRPLGGLLCFRRVFSKSWVSDGFGCFQRLGRRMEFSLIQHRRMRATCAGLDFSDSRVFARDTEWWNGPVAAACGGLRDQDQPQEFDDSKSVVSRSRCLGAELVSQAAMEKEEVVFKVWATNGFVRVARRGLVRIEEPSHHSQLDSPMRCRQGRRSRN